MLTTQQAAKKYGITRGRIIQLIASKIIKATKFGWSYQIDEKDLEGVEWPRKPGRPSKKIN